MRFTSLPAGRQADRTQINTMKIDTKFKKELVLNKMKGFTLMEVLVASAIFAVVMAIATGVIAQGSSYGTKIKKMRETSEDARRLADMLTRDIKSAKSPIRALYNTTTYTIKDTADTGAIEGLFNPGILLLNNLSQLNYDSSGTALLDSNAQYDAASIVIAGSTNYMIYTRGWNCPYALATPPSLPSCVYYSNSISVDTLLTNQMIASIQTEGNIISNTSLSSEGEPLYKTLIGFGGFNFPVPSNVTSTSVQSMQPLVNFVVTVSVKSFDNTIYKGESATIRSSVTSRNYGI